MSKSRLFALPIIKKRRKSLENSNKNTIFAPNIRNKKLMTRQLLKLTFAATLALTVPMSLLAVSTEPATEQQSNDREITIAVQQSTLLVSNAQGETLQVVSLTGNKVMEVKIESPSQRIELDIPKGCYIVKVGKVVRKIAIR
jgi:secreted PhoX family phosphatase